MAVEKYFLSKIALEYIIKGMDWSEELCSREDFQIILIEKYDFSVDQSERFINDLLKKDLNSQIIKNIAFPLLVEIKKEDGGITIDGDFYVEIENEAKEIGMKYKDLLFLYKKLIREIMSEPDIDYKLFLN